MDTYVPAVSVVGVGLAFATLVTVRPRLWLRWLSCLLIAVLFGVGAMVASVPVMEELRATSSVNPFLPLQIGMLAGDVAFFSGAFIAAATARA